MFDKSSIQSLIEKVNLLEVIKDYVSLQENGPSWRGFSPFVEQRGKAPSLYAYPDRNFFICFETSLGGDAIKFFQIQENCTFDQAVEMLAERFNVQLERKV